MLIKMEGVQYCCPRCHYETEYKNNMRNHYRRKKPCEPKFSDVHVSVLLAELSSPDPETHKFCCNHCNKRYASRQGLYLHNKQCTGAAQQQQPQKPDSENTTTQDLLNYIKQLEQMIKDKDKNTRDSASTSTGNTTNIYINNFNNMNINTNNFGDEDTSHVSEEYKLQCLKQMNNGFLNLLRHIHFNKDVPENWNVAFKSNEKLWVKRDDTWQEADSRTLTDALIQKIRGLLWPVFSSHAMTDETIINTTEVLFNWFTVLGSRVNVNIYNDLKRDIPVLIKNETRLLNLLERIHLSTPSIRAPPTSMQNTLSS